MSSKTIKPGQAVLVYMDEGAKGPCAQCMSITAPGTSIHIFQDFDALRDYVSEKGTDVKKYRKKPVWRYFIVGEDGEDSIQFHCEV